ncbi:MAG: hypothetical protein K6B43_08110 [Treponema sp.]|nr:hypothetical protein [Treponema sp.]
MVEDDIASYPTVEEYSADEIANIVSSLQRLEEVLKENGKQRNNLQSQLSAAKREVDIKTQELSDKVDRISRLDSDVYFERERNAELQQKVDTLSSEKNKLAEVNGEIKSNYANAQSRLTEQESRIKNLESELKEKEKSIYSLNSALVFSKNLIAELQQKVDSLSSEKDKLVEEKTKVENNYEHANNLIVEQKSKIETLESELKKKEEYVSSLNSNIANYLKQRTELQQKVSLLSSEKDSLQSENSAMKDKLQKIDFDSVKKAFDAYKSIPEDIRKIFKNVFRVDSLIGFVVGGVQYGAKELYDMVAKLVRGKQQENLEELKSVSKYFIDLYNNSCEKPKYEIFTVEIESKFDSNKCYSLDGTPDGTVEKVELFGLKTDGTVTNKAIVTIRKER